MCASISTCASLPLSFSLSFSLSLSLSLSPLSDFSYRNIKNDQTWCAQLQNRPKVSHQGTKVSKGIFKDITC